MRESAPMRAFWILQKRPEMTKMTPDDLLTLKTVLTEPPGNAEHFLKIIFFATLQRTNSAVIMLAMAFRLIKNQNGMKVVILRHP